MRKLFKSFIVTLSLAASSTMPAYGAYIVLDPANLWQSILTAAAAVKTEITTAATYVQEAQQTIHMIRSTMSIDGLANLAGVQKELALYRDLQSTNQQIQIALGQSQQLARDVQAQFGSSNFSWEQFLKSRSYIDTSRINALKRQYEVVNRSLTDNANRRKEIIDQLQGAQGQTAATQAVGAQIDIVIGQNQQMLNQLATEKMQEADKIEADKAAREAVRAQNNAYQKRLRESSERWVN